MSNEEAYKLLNKENTIEDYFDRWLGEFEIANPCPTDLNGDGQTTTSDLLIFLGAFGTDC